MLRSFRTCLNGCLLDGVDKNVVKETEFPSSLVYRDELDRKHSQKAVDVGDQYSYPLNQREDSRKVKKEVVRVKIRMTKREAEKLLSRCRTDGGLDFRHVATQIASVPAERVDIMMMPCHHDAKAALSSILEEA